MPRAREKRVENDGIDGPAILTAAHRSRPALDDDMKPIIGKTALRRVDRLQWLADHGSIADFQLYAGRRLQQDWQLSKIENSPSMQFGGRGGGAGGVSQAAIDAGRRVARAMAVLPRELRQLTELFLMPEDHPFSLERCAAIVNEDRRAAAYGIRISLSLLARHYGYAM